MKKILSLFLVLIMLVTAMPMAFAEGNTYKVGDIIQFGSYPQSEVKDEALIAKLNSIAPKWEDWTSYGYYSGDGEYGSMVQGDWMRYIDVTYNGKKYRGVKFTQYRPYYTYSYSSKTHQDQNGYNINTVYWFKFEPIDWRVLDVMTGLVMCETAIDAQPFNNEIYVDYDDPDYSRYSDPLFTNYCNDFEMSFVRNWLNTDFYKTSFSNSEKTEILDTCIDNKGYLGDEEFDGNNTTDKIFLASYKDIGNSNYGFNSNRSSKDIYRCAKASDYAACQGSFVESKGEYAGNTLWLLRTSGTESDYVCDVDQSGTSKALYVHCPTYLVRGIRPMLRIASVVHICDYKFVVTPSTCTTQGYTTYTCECGDTYKADYVNANGHKFESEITTPATHLTEGVETFTCHCGDTYTKAISKLEAHTYISAVTKSPTHLEEGVRTYTCECTHSYTESISKITEHTYSVDTINATCTQNGLAFYKCACGDSYTKTIEKLPHNYSSVVTQATCETDGYTTYTCKCGDTYVGDNTPAKGHSFDGSACTDCDYDKSDSCSCNCHKSGIANLIFKIILFFQKFFRTNGECACGARHW